MFVSIHDISKQALRVTSENEAELHNTQEAEACCECLGGMSSGALVMRMLAASDMHKGVKMMAHMHAVDVLLHRCACCLPASQHCQEYASKRKVHAEVTLMPQEGQMNKASQHSICCCCTMSVNIRS